MVPVTSFLRRSDKSISGWVSIVPGSEVPVEVHTVFCYISFYTDRPLCKVHLSYSYYYYLMMYLSWSWVILSQRFCVNSDFVFVFRVGFGV